MKLFVLVLWMTFSGTITSQQVASFPSEIDCEAAGRRAIVTMTNSGLPRAGFVCVGVPLLLPE